MDPRRVAVRVVRLLQKGGGPRGDEGCSRPAGADGAPSHLAGAVRVLATATTTEEASTASLRTSPASWPNAVRRHPACPISGASPKVGAMIEALTCSARSPAPTESSCAAEAPGANSNAHTATAHRAARMFRASTWPRYKGRRPTRPVTRSQGVPFTAVTTRKRSEKSPVRSIRMRNGLRAAAFSAFALFVLVLVPSTVLALGPGTDLSPGSAIPASIAQAVDHLGDEVVVRPLARGRDANEGSSVPHGVVGILGVATCAVYGCVRQHRVEPVARGNGTAADAELPSLRAPPSDVVR